MTPEKKFEAQIIEKLQARGWFAHHFDANGLDGWPDILALVNGRLLLIEVKAGTAVRPAQRAFHALLAQTYGTSVHVIEQRKGAVILDGEACANLHDAMERLDP